MSLEEGVGRGGGWEEDRRPSRRDEDPAYDALSPGRRYGGGRTVRRADRADAGHEAATATADSLCDRLRQRVRAKLRAEGSHGKPVEVVAGIRKVFKKFDKDGSKTLDNGEFSDACRQLAGGELSQAELDELFDKLDLNKSRSIQVEEFVSFLSYDKPTLRRVSAVLRRRVKENGGIDTVMGVLAGSPTMLDARQLQTVTTKLGLDLSSGESKTLLSFLDTTGDNVVSRDELEAWLSTETEGLEPIAEEDLDHTKFVVDLRITGSPAEADRARADGYERMETSLNLGNMAPPLYLWQLKMSAADVDATTLKARRLVDVVVYGKRDSAPHVAAGFECIRHSVNSGTWFGRSEYVWVRRNSAMPNDPNAITDVCVVREGLGPPHAGYRQVSGDLNAFTVGKSLHLMFKKPSFETENINIRLNAPRQELRHAVDERLRFKLREAAAVVGAPAQPPRADAAAGGGRVPPLPVGAPPAPGAAEGGLDFESLFRRLAHAGPEQLLSSVFISRRQFATAVKDDIGLDLPKGEVKALAERIDTDKDRIVSLAEFMAFVQHDTEGQLLKVLDQLIERRDRGLSFAQIFGQDIVSRRGRPLEPYVTEQMFTVALDGMHMPMAAKERADLYHALGFGAHGYLLHTQLDHLLARRRDSLARANAVLPNLRRHLLQIAKSRPLPRGLNFDHVWDSMRLTAKCGKMLVLDGEALGRVLYTDMKVTRDQLPMEEVPMVLKAMGGSAPVGSPAVHVDLSTFKVFLSEEEAAADMAVDKVVANIRARRADPKLLFESLDTDRSGGVGAAELRLFLNDLEAKLPEKDRHDFTHEDVRALVRRFDADGDGSLSLREFVTALRRHAPDLPHIPTPRSMSRPIVQLHLSTSADREAALTRRRCRIVPGDVRDGSEPQAMRLWVEYGSPQHDRGERLDDDSLVSLCVVPPQPSGDILDQLDGGGFEQVLTRLPNGYSLYGRDTHAMSKRASTSSLIAIERVALTVAKPAEGAPSAATTLSESHHKRPGVGWSFAGAWPTTDGRSVGLWYYGGAVHGMTELAVDAPGRGKAAVDTLDDGAVGDAAAAPPRGASRTPLRQASEVVTVRVYGGRRLVPAGRYQRLSCRCALHTPKARKAVSDAEETGMASTGGVAPSWDHSKRSTVSLRPREDVDAHPDDMEVKMHVVGHASSAAASSVKLAVCTVPVRPASRSRKEAVSWYDCVDRYGLRVGQLRVGVSVGADRTRSDSSDGWGTDDGRGGRRRSLDSLDGRLPSPPSTRRRVNRASHRQLVLSAVATPGVEDLAEDTVGRDADVTARVWVEVDGRREGRAQTLPIAAGRSGDRRHRRLGRRRGSDDWSDSDGGGGDEDSTTVRLPRAAEHDTCLVIAVYAAPAPRGRHRRTRRGSDGEESRPTEVGRAKVYVSDAVRASRSRRSQMEVALRQKRSVSASSGGRSTYLQLKVWPSMKREAAGGQFGGGAAAIVRRIASQLSALPGGVATLTTHLSNAAQREAAAGRVPDQVPLSALADALRRVDVDLSGSRVERLVAWLRRRERRRGTRKPLEWSGADDSGSASDDVDSDADFDYRHLCSLLSQAAVGVGTSFGAPGGVTVTDPAVAAVVRGLRTAAAAGQDPLDTVLAMYDRDGLGRITTADLFTCLRRLGCQVMHSDVPLVLAALAVPIDGFGKIEWRQFTVAMQRYLPAGLSSSEQLLRMRVRESAWFANNYLDFRAPFAAADVDGRGRLTPHQFHEAVTRLGVPMSMPEVNELMTRLDTNLDGSIDYYEFAKLIDLDAAEVRTIGAKLASHCAVTGVATFGGPRAQFSAADGLQSGTVSGPEFKSIVQTCGLPLSPVEIALLSRYFASGVSRVDYKRFLQFMATGVDGGVGSGDTGGGLTGGPLAATTSRMLHLQPDQVQRWLATATPQERATLTHLMQSMSGGGGGMAPPGSPPRHSYYGRGDGGGRVSHLTTPVRGAPSPLVAGSPSTPPPGSPPADPKRERFQSTGIWSCPVCYYTQTTPWAKTCKMCGSANPYASAGAQVGWLCPACTYGNPAGATSCGMCGMGLRGPPPSPHTETAAAMRAVSPSRGSVASAIDPRRMSVMSAYPTDPRRSSVMSFAGGDASARDPSNALAHLEAFPTTPGSLAQTTRLDSSLRRPSSAGTAGGGARRWSTASRGWGGGAPQHAAASDAGSVYLAPNLARSLDFAPGPAGGPRGRWGGDSAATPSRWSARRPSTGGYGGSTWSNPGTPGGARWGSGGRTPGHTPTWRGGSARPAGGRGGWR